MTKVWSEVMWVLPNVIMEQSNFRIKKISTTECDKSMVRSNVGTAQCNNETVKFENKKIGYH